MDVLEIFEDIFNRHRHPSASVMERMKEDFGRRRIFKLALHRNHPELGLCYEIEDEKDPEHTYVSISLIACWGVDPENRLERYFLNDNYEQNIDYLYRIARFRVPSDSKDPFVFGDSSNEEKFMQDWSVTDWELAAVTAKLELCEELVKLVALRHQAVQDIRIARRMKRTPPVEERYVVEELPIDPEAGVAKIFVGKYPSGATSFGFEESMITGDGKGKLVINAAFEVSIDIPLFKEQAREMGKPSANFVSGLADIGDIGGLMIIPRGITLLPERKKKIDCHRVSRLLARSFGYPFYQLFNCLNNQSLSEVLPSQ